VRFIGRSLEIGEAKVLIFVRADEEQMLTLPTCELGMLPARWHEPAQHLTQGPGQAAPGDKRIGILEL
jgi:hypothetical protein